MSKWLELIKLLGPKVQAVLPLILAIFETLATASPSSRKSFAASQGAASGEEFDRCVDECKSQGMDESQAKQLCSQLPKLPE